MGVSLRENTPYMMRKSSELLSVSNVKMHPYLMPWAFDGDKPSDCFTDMFESEEFDSLKWFYDNTDSNTVKDDIQKLIVSVDNYSEEHADEIDFYLDDSVRDAFDLDSYKGKLIDSFDELVSLFKSLDDRMNNEFLKVRMSGKFDSETGKQGSIYFRVSSNDYDWFNTIYMFVADNKPKIQHVTIIKDHQSSLKNFQGDYYKTRDGEEINEMPVKEFLEIEKAPIIEQLERGNNKMEKKVINIREELSKYDKRDDDTFYNLVNMYEGMNYTTDKKKEFATFLLKENLSSKDIFNYMSGKMPVKKRLTESVCKLREEDDNRVPEDIEVGDSYETISGYITRVSENKYKVYDDTGMLVYIEDNFKDAYDASMSMYDPGEEDPYWEEQRELDDYNYRNRSDHYEDDEEESEYEFLSRKTVKDSDGFNTDYAWYKSPNGTNVFVFGDMDYYRPEDGVFDFETESDTEAKEWFDDYKGPGDEDEEEFDEDLEQSPEQLTEKSNLIENIKNTCKNCIFYEENGIDVIEKFIINQPSKMAAKICYNFTKLNELGKNARYPLTRHLGDGIFEMRTDFASDATRCLFFFIYGNEMVFTNGFVKKSGKTPPNEIELAKNRRNTYINNNESSGEM